MTRRPDSKTGKARGTAQGPWSDIGKSITIVGRLNHPLGQEITISGEWM